MLVCVGWRWRTAGGAAEQLILETRWREHLETATPDQNYCRRASVNIIPYTSWCRHVLISQCCTSIPGQRDHVTHRSWANIALGWVRYSFALESSKFSFAFKRALTSIKTFRPIEWSKAYPGQILPYELGLGIDRISPWNQANTSLGSIK